MKKLLLLSALALCASAANADYTEYFKVYNNGVEVKSGQTVYSNHYVDPVFYELDLNVVSQVANNQVLEANMVHANGNTNGVAQLCFETLAEYKGQVIPDSNCWNELPNATVLYPEYLSDGQASNFIWQVEATGVNLEETSEWVFSFVACDGDEEYYEPIEGAEFSITVIFTQEEDAAVAGIDADSLEAPVYYNLQGVRVNNPDKGIYIVKKGSKISKVVL